MADGRKLKVILLPVEHLLLPEFCHFLPTWQKTPVIGQSASSKSLGFQEFASSESEKVLPIWQKKEEPLAEPEVQFH